MPTKKAVEEGVSREKRITQMKLAKVKEQIEVFEEKNDMDSEEFRERFQSGELGDEKEFMKWDMLLDAKEELEQKKEELSRFNA
jgi:Mg/Co/Ni transporter MgtE